MEQSNRYSNRTHSDEIPERELELEKYQYDYFDGPAWSRYANTFAECSLKKPMPLIRGRSFGPIAMNTAKGNVAGLVTIFAYAKVSTTDIAAAWLEFREKQL